MSDMTVTREEVHRAVARHVRNLTVVRLAPPAVPERRDLSQQVDDVLRQAGHDEQGDTDFGWRLHRPVEDGAHLAITCEPNDYWRCMPRAATRTGVAWHLARYADVLTKAGLGVVSWGRDDQMEILIVAVDQETADREAATVIPRIAELNPSAQQSGRRRDGC